MEDVTGKFNPIEQFIAWMTLLNAWEGMGLAIIVGAVLFAMWRMNKNDKTSFSFADAFLDPMTQKTSLEKIVVFGCFVGCWMVAFWRLLLHEDVSSLVLLILSVFVGKQAFDRGMEVIDPRVKAQAFNTAPGSQPKPEPQPLQPPPAPEVQATLNVNK